MKPAGEDVPLPPRRRFLRRSLTATQLTKQVIA
jgi:hypothetical protein